VRIKPAADQPVKENADADVLTPFLTELFYKSLIMGAVPTTFKSAHNTTHKEARPGSS